MKGIIKELRVNVWTIAHFIIVVVATFVQLPSCTSDDMGADCENLEFKFQGTLDDLITDLLVGDSMLFERSLDGLLVDTVSLKLESFETDFIHLHHCNNATRSMELKWLQYRWSADLEDISLAFLKSGSTSTDAFATWGELDLYSRNFFHKSGYTIVFQKDTFFDCRSFDDVLSPVNNIVGLGKYFDSNANVQFKPNTSKAFVYLKRESGLVLLKRINPDGVIESYKRI